MAASKDPRKTEAPEDLVQHARRMSPSTLDEALVALLDRLKTGSCTTKDLAAALIVLNEKVARGGTRLGGIARQPGTLRPDPRRTTGL